MNNTRLIFFLVLLLSVIGELNAQFAGGNGTPSNPYQISTVEQLQLIRPRNQNNQNHYILINDIDATVTKTWNSGRGFDNAQWEEGFSPFSFVGSLDGKGFKIINLYINRGTSLNTGYNMGLIAILGDNGTVKNLTLQGAEIIGYKNVGGVVGYVAGGTVENVSFAGKVTGRENVGGVIGSLLPSISVKSIFSAGEVNGTGGDYVGGLIGVSQGNISESGSTSKVTSTGRYVGGIAGTVSGLITTSYSKGEVRGKEEVGGIAGELYGLDILIKTYINNSYSSSKVYGDRAVGGLIGRFARGVVERTLFYGTVDYNQALVRVNVGSLVGFLGESYSVSLGFNRKSYFDNQINSLYPAIGSGGNSSEIVGTSTAALQGQFAVTTLAGYDFNTVWSATSGYPRLAWEMIVQVPSVTTSAASNITSNGATLSGNVTTDGGATVTARGICFSTSQNPTLSNTCIQLGTGTGTFTGAISGLVSGTQYYARAYATNSVGTSYGSQIQFSTLATLPNLGSSTAANITANSASVTSNVISDGGSAITMRGVCYSPDNQGFNCVPASTNGIGTFTVNISPLNAGTLYYVKSFGTNSVGSVFGVTSTFTTTASIPTITLGLISDITSSSAIVAGNVASSGGASVISRGICYSTSENPTTSSNCVNSGSGIGSFSSNLSGLSAATKYYARAFATNSAGTAYSSQSTFTTVSNTPPGSVSDIDGNVYTTVVIGTQEWITSNLRTTRYRNGATIPNYMTDDQWNSATTTNIGAWVNYANSAPNDAVYGKLYNWYAVNNASGLCPTGWRVPSDSDWTALWNYLGENAGLKMKSTTGWLNNKNGTNSSGFNGQPGGFRTTGQPASFFGISFYGEWWSSTGTLQGASKRTLFANSDDLLVGGLFPPNGLSVRCMRDAQTVSVPVVTTLIASNITSTSATVAGNVTSDGGATVTARGVCYSTSQNPTTSGTCAASGSGTGSFSASITGLSAGVTYYARAFATNSAGTAYGTQSTFTTLASTATVTDVDGNVYQSVRIGNQTWMASNLRTTKYRDNSFITAVQNGTTQWRDIKAGGWIHYNGASSNDATYGKLYNWYAVNDSRNLCPTGWQIPTSSDWQTLVTFLGDSPGTQLKSLTGWATGGNGTNTSGFTAIPGGFVNDLGGFGELGVSSSFWTSTQSDAEKSISYYLRSNRTDVLTYSDTKNWGFSVRCIMSTPTSVDGDELVVRAFELGQNYPNPFNPSTVISFELANAGVSKLSVYDLLGREVAVLFSGSLPAGVHQVTFDASGLASGVYIYRLEAGGEVFTRRMTLVK